MKKEELIKENKELKEKYDVLQNDFRKMEEQYYSMQALSDINIQLQNKNLFLEEENKRLNSSVDYLSHRLETYETVFEVLKEKVGE